MKKLHPLLRLAVKIHRQLYDAPETRLVRQLPDVLWNRGQYLIGRIYRAEDRGWHLASAQLRRELRRVLADLATELNEISAGCCQPRQRERLVTVPEIYQDLLSLKDEFDDLSFSSRAGTLSVATEPVVLEGVDLGRFEIELSWQTLGDESPYRVIALDPNPATTNESVTHPHVQDERVCEGDARQAIAAALADGRIADFFAIVANLLRTYNAESPFIPLHRWHGFDCQDCGDGVTPDDGYSCEKCGANLCGSCYLVCSSCDSLYCSGCSSICELCHECCCGGCLYRCSACRTRVCQNCLDDDERCQKCHEEENEAEEEYQRQGHPAVAHLRIGACDDQLHAAI